MSRKYYKYTAEELLDDDFFIQSTIHPTPESDTFWVSLIEEGILSEDEYLEAYSFMQVVRKKEKKILAKEKSQLWVAIEVKNKENLHKKIKKRNFYLYGLVASFLAVVSSSVFLLIKQEIVNPLTTTVLKPLKNDNIQEIQLIMSENQTYTISEKHAAIELNDQGDIKINSEPISRQSSKRKEHEESRQMSQLVTPKGKQSKLTLSDGTLVYANSGTRIFFPEKFQKNKREIFVDGEIYLDVSHNKDWPFVVRTNKMEVEVLGTSFNVSAYSQDLEQSIVLVTGSVTVKTDKKEIIHLLPKQMASYGRSGVVVTKVEVEQYLAWKDGFLFCDKENLVSVINRISRHYGVEIECKDDVIFFVGNGKLDLKDDLQRVLDGLSDIFPINIKKNENGIFYVTKK